MTIRQKVLTGVILIGAFMLLSGCSPSDYIEKKIGENAVEKSLESQTGGKIDIDADKKQMNIKSKDGDFSMSGEGTATLSPDFPKDIYIAPDAKIIFSMADGKNKSYSAAYVTDQSVDDICSKYKNDFEKNGWVTESWLGDTRTEMGPDNSKVFSYKKGTQDLMIIVGLSQEEKWKGKTSVQVTGQEDETKSQSSDPIDMDKKL
ncbi:MAG TPA: hypothetical protein VK255_00335 [Patescibacteria group bacterium]|nr:hypothetical protein [Patescibacteria group bacterium]